MIPELTRIRLGLAVLFLGVGVLCASALHGKLESSRSATATIGMAQQE